MACLRDASLRIPLGYSPRISTVPRSSCCVAFGRRSDPDRGALGFIRLLSCMPVAASVVVCGFWAVLLFGTDGMQWWRDRKVLPEVEQETPSVECPDETPELIGAS